MRKYLLFALFVVLAYVANMYFTTGQLPLMEKRALTEEEEHLHELKQDFLELRESYYEQKKDSFFEEELTPEETLKKIEKIAKKLDLLRPDLNSEFAKAQAGWLNMIIRKFKKSVDLDHAK